MPARRRAPAVRQHGERRRRRRPRAATGRAGTQVCQAVQRVDGAGVRRARVGAHDERPQAGGPVRGDRPLEDVEAQVVRAVHGDDAHPLGPEAERPGGAGHRRVTLRRDVDDEVVAHGADEPLARARERRQVGRRTAADQYAGGVGGVADPLGEPREHGELQLRHAGAAGPPAAVELEGAGDEVGHGAGPGREAGDEGHVARRIRPAPVGRHVGEDAVEEFLIREAKLRRAAPGDAGAVRPQSLHGPRAASRTGPSRRPGRRWSDARSPAFAPCPTAGTTAHPRPSCTPLVAPRSAPILRPRHPLVNGD